MLRYCRVELRDYGIETIYPNGSRSANWIPTIEREAFVRLSESLGFRDPLEYLRHHDLSHSFLSDRMFGIASPTLYSAAHGERRHGVIDRRQNHYEERMVYYWQRFVAFEAQPIDDDWLRYYDEYVLIATELGLWPIDRLPLRQ